MNLRDCKRVELPSAAGFYTETLTSTQDVLKNAYKEGVLTTDTTLFSSYQTHGHGRDQRKWLGLPSPQLYCSYYTQLTLNEAYQNQLPTLSLITAIAIVRALTAQLPKDYGIKWPNDLILQGKKLGGILIDLLKSQNKQHHFLIGFGLNLTAEPQDWPDELRNTAIALSQKKWDFDQCLQLLQAILSSLQICFKQFSAQGFSAFHDEFNRLSWLNDREITIQTASQVLHGRVKNISTGGELILLQKSGATVHLLSGHILNVS